jgi:hypothetical protein
MSRLNLGTFPVVGVNAGVVAAPSGSSSNAVDPGEGGGVTVTSITGLAKGDVYALRNAGGGNVTVSPGGNIHMTAPITLTDSYRTLLFVACSDSDVALV